MSEQTMEELTAKLESLKKENIEREIANEQAKVDEAAKLSEEKKADELRETIKSEVIADMEAESVIVTNTPEVEHAEGTTGFWETWKSDMTKKYGFTGETYEDRARRVSTGGFRGVRK